MAFTLQVYAHVLPGQQREAADAIEAAVQDVLKRGIRTADIAKPGEKAIGTKEMGLAVRESLRTVLA